MILLTGSTGLIGSQILFDLASKGMRVRALKRNESDMISVNRVFSELPSALKNVEWVDGNLNDLFSLEQAFDGIDTVYHSAALISFLPAERNLMMKTNVEGTANMVNMSLRGNVKRFCFVSSVAALGRVEGIEKIDENSWWKTSSKNSNYAISKYGSEREVWRGMEEGLSAFIINPSIVIGPGNWNSGSSQMFTRVWKGLPFYALGSTGFVDVRDVSDCAIKLMDAGISNERFIINSENVSYRYVFDLIAESLGKSKAKIGVNKFLTEAGWIIELMKSRITGTDPLITKETARNGGQHWAYSNSKVTKILNKSFITIEQSVRETGKIFLSENNK